MAQVRGNSQVRDAPEALENDDGNFERIEPPALQFIENAINAPAKRSLRGQAKDSDFALRAQANKTPILFLHLQAESVGIEIPKDFPPAGER